MTNKLTVLNETALTSIDAAGKIFDMMDVSDMTRKEYKYRIGDFRKFIGDSKPTRNSFREYRNHLANRVNRAVSTKNKLLTTAKLFLKEIHRQGVIQIDITAGVKSFKQSTLHKRDGVTEDEIQLLAGTLKSLPSTPVNTRVKALFSLLIFQGLRQIEIARLNISDIDLIRGIAFVQGKGRDDTEPVDLHPRAVKALREYLKVNKICDGPLFQSRSNNNKNKRITTRSVQMIAKDVLNDLGIKKSTHGFRHYFVTKLIRDLGGNLLDVAQYTRHRSVETLQVYYDRVRKTEDLPKYYKAFEGVSI